MCGCARSSPLAPFPASCGVGQVKQKDKRLMASKPTRSSALEGAAHGIWWRLMRMVAMDKDGIPGPVEKLLAKSKEQACWHGLPFHCGSETVLWLSLPHEIVFGNELLILLFTSNLLLVNWFVCACRLLELPLVVFISQQSSRLDIKFPVKQQNI